MSTGAETLFLQPESRPRNALPPDLLSRACERLRTLLLLAVALSAVAMVVAIGNLALEIGTARGARAGVLLHGILLALELVMLAVIRSPRLSAERRISIALGWQVAVCAAISVVGAWIVIEEQGVIPRVTWTSLLIVVVPLLLPAPRRLVAIALTGSALTVPLGLLGLESFGRIELSGADLIGSAVSPALALALGIIVSRITFAYARDLAKARALGAYELEDRIGAGGMGEVWRGSHRLLARDAAIKFIRPDRVGNEKTVARFKAEAQAIARLRSPHTVELYDFGKSPDERLYYVMELLEGLDLHTLVSRFGPQPPERVARMLGQICHSLGEAHEAGLVHRDIKPANIFLCRMGRDVDVIKVLDFGVVGIARGLGADAGTPGFVPPEADRDEEIDGRGDLWAVGRVALFLLVGDHGADAEAIDHPELAAIVARCLADNPDDRPKTADELAAELAGLELDERWTEQRAASWWRANQPELSEAAIAADTVTAD